MELKTIKVRWKMRGSIMRDCRIDTLGRSKRRNREPLDEFIYYQRGKPSTEDSKEGATKVSYRDTMVRRKGIDLFNKMEELVDSVISDDILVEEGDGKM